MLAAIWIVAVIGIALWSLIAWGLHRVLTLDPQWVGDLEPLIDRIPYADVIERWVPGWRDILRAAIDMTQTVLEHAGDYVPWLVGLIWGAGTLAIAGLAVVFSLLVVLLRDARRPAPPPAPPR
jgi:predicted PurR-regulated permease PerM